MKYKIASEYSAPTYYDVETNEELYNECQASLQAYWVCSYDEDEHEILEWIESFPNTDDAKKYIGQLDKEDK